MSQGSPGLAAQGQGCAAVDRDPVGNNLVAPGPVLLRLEGVSVGGIGVEGERALDCERSLHIRSSCRGKERAGPAAGANGSRAGNGATPTESAAVYPHLAGTGR